MGQRQNVAFMSYVRYDDKYENGGITKFRECLSAAVKVHTGEEFKIFQDREDIEGVRAGKKTSRGRLTMLHSLFL